MWGEDTDSTASSTDASPVRRRDVLRSTAGLAVGAAGVAATTGSASATIEALFESLDCSSGWATAPEDYPILDLRDDSPSRIGDWPADPSRLTIFVHGLGADSDGIWRDQAQTLENAANQNGWNPTLVGTLYDTGSDSLDWDQSVSLAKTAGRRLAGWIEGVAGDLDAINVVAHSLGGHVTGTLLNELGGDVVLGNVGLLGPAVPNFSVCEDDGQYGAGIAASANAVHNYRSWDDEVICDLYESEILGSGEDGLGCNEPECGWFDAPPENFEDHSQTASVDKHCDYPRPDVGCIDDLVEDFGVV